MVYRKVLYYKDFNNNFYTGTKIWKIKGILLLTGQL